MIQRHDSFTPDKLKTQKPLSYESSLSGKKRLISIEIPGAFVTNKKGFFFFRLMERTQILCTMRSLKLY